MFKSNNYRASEDWNSLNHDQGSKLIACRSAGELAYVFW